MNIRRPLDGQAMALMLALCLIWGFQQVALKTIAGEVTPLLQVALRSGLAAVLLGGFMLARGQNPLPRDGVWRPGLAAGALFAFEYLVVGQGLVYTTASHIVVFLYTAPVFAALGLHWKLPDERLRAGQWGGIALAFAGIVLAFFWHSETATGGQIGLGRMLWGDFLGLLGGAAWGLTTVVIRTTRLSNAPAAQTLLCQLLGAFLLLMPAAAALGQLRVALSPTVVGYLAFQTVIVSFASFLVWFWLLRKYLATRLGVFSFLTPLFGVAFGVLFLGDPLEPGFVVGALLVLAGIMLVSRRR